MKALTDREMIEIQGYLDDDSGGGDPTGSLFDGSISKASMIAEEDCILSGIEAVRYIFESLECTVSMEDGAASGSIAGKGSCILTVEGPTENILKGERVALNMISRMSGIATISKEASKLAEESSPGTRVAGTRKTTPGFYLFEKRALVDGGALPHRMDLSSLAMLKDNHLEALGGGPDAVLAGVEIIREKYGPYMLIEVEVEDIPSGLAAVEAGADIIMLDNFSSESIGVASAEIIRTADAQGREITLEASGGIKTENIKDFAPYVDVISMGILTYGAPSKGFKLEMMS